MKKIIVVLLFIGICTTSFTQVLKSSFILTGKVVGLNNGLLYLYYPGKDGKGIKDSSLLKNGHFSFGGKLTEPTMAYLQLKEEKRTELNNTNFFVEPAVMNINLTLNMFRDAKITGSKVQNEYASLQRLKESIRKEMQPLSDAYIKENQAYMSAVKSKKDDHVLDSMKEVAAELHNRFEPYNARMDKLDYQFFAKHPRSYVTAYSMRFHISKLSLDSLELFYNRLGKDLQHSNQGKEVASEIVKLRAGSPGSIAKDFTTIDINGNTLSLSDYKGKYVLLDFWASWCVPCRHGNPHLKELYAKYKNKGIEFIGIADDDRAEDAWKKAVEKDDIGIWKHVRRGLKFQNGVFDRSTDISEKFGTHTLPTKILIDRTGLIIGRYGEDEEALNKKLKEVFE